MRATRPGTVEKAPVWSTRPPRPRVRRRPQAEAPLSQRVESDLTAEAPVSEAELAAIERLLGEDLAAFLAELN